MSNWLSQNIVNIVIIAALVLAVGLVIRGMIRDRRAGRSSCGGNCAACGACCAHAVVRNPDRYGSGRLIRTVVRIEGMMCGMCEAHINDAVRRAIPVKKVSSSHTKGETVIITETVPDGDLIRKAVTDSGYRVLEVVSSPDRIQNSGLRIQPQ